MASFLGLPSEVRAEIMCYAGLTRCCTIGFSQEIWRLKKVPPANRTRSEQNQLFLCGPEHARHYETDGEVSSLIGGIHYCASETFFCTHQAIPFALLLVNRQIHDEAESLLYGRNRFYVNSQDMTSVACIERLSSNALATLSELHISFDAKTQGDMHPGSSCFVDRTYDPQDQDPWPLNLHMPTFSVPQAKEALHPSLRHDPAYRSHNRVFDAAIQKFGRLCMALCDTSRLSITLSSNVKSMQLAREILDSFAAVPHLKALTVGFRWGNLNRQDPEFAQFTVDVVSTIEKICRPKAAQHNAFPFERLPGELQDQILALALGNSAQKYVKWGEFGWSELCCGDWPPQLQYNPYNPYGLASCACRRDHWSRRMISDTISSTCNCAPNQRLAIVSKGIRDRVASLLALDPEAQKIANKKLAILSNVKKPISMSDLIHRKPPIDLGRKPRRNRKRRRLRNQQSSLLIPIPSTVIQYSLYINESQSS